MKFLLGFAVGLVAGWVGSAVLSALHAEIVELEDLAEYEDSLPLVEEWDPPPRA